jgi:Domain of unknown function (DUF4160)
MAFKMTWVSVFPFEYKPPYMRMYNQSGDDMAELSRFFGIIIRMFAEHGGKHRTAHFHAFYAEHEAVFQINPIQLLEGSLPTKQKRLVEAWAEIHQEELQTAWKSLDGGRKPSPIQPLS